MTDTNTNTSALTVIQDRNLPVANRVDGLRKLMMANKEKIALGADKLLNPERMIQVACLSIKKNPRLLDCTPASLLGAIAEAAAYGWVCDGVIGQASLVPFKNECVLIPGYKGLRDLVRRSGECDTVMESVHEGDQFDFINPFQPPKHIRSGARDRKFLPVTHVYVLGQFKSGAIKCFTMSADECKAHRDHYSQGWKRARGTSSEADSPWSEQNPAFRVMCMKTCMLDAIHRGEFPMSVADMQVAVREPTIAAAEASTIETDSPLIEIGEPLDAGYVVDVESDPPVEPQDSDADFANAARIDEITQQAIASIENATEPDLIAKIRRTTLHALSELNDDGVAVATACAARIKELKPKSTKQQTMV